jgi:hypothetical protein
MRRLNESSVPRAGGRSAGDSSRIRPANDRETSRNHGNGWSNESAGREPDSDIAAGSETGLEDTLKVETRVQIPLGLRNNLGKRLPDPPRETERQHFGNDHPPSSSPILLAASRFSSGTTSW